MKALFSSPDLQRQFEADGFVRMPLLAPGEVADLMAAYQAVAAEHEKIGIPYITTSHSNNADLIARVDEVLQRVMAPAIDRYLTDYRLLFGNFLVKMPVNHSETSPHQDITFVDETQYASVNIWVALQDVDRQNGCMYFLKGSHAFMPGIRPTHEYTWAYEPHKDEIMTHSEVFTARAGDAFIFNHAVIHGSFPNGSGTPRVAAVVAAYPAEARLIHYYLPDADKNTLQRYGMTKEAYLHFKKGHPPAKGVFEGEEEYEFRHLGPQEFRALLKPEKGRGSLLGRLFKKWGNG